jgi:hypothetical protein
MFMDQLRVSWNAYGPTRLILELIVDHLSEMCLDHVWSISRPIGCHTYGYTTLRDRFRINGNHMELTKNVSSNIGRVLETSERFW